MGCIQSSAVAPNTDEKNDTSKRGGVHWDTKAKDEDSNPSVFSSVKQRQSSDRDSELVEGDIRGMIQATNSKVWDRETLKLTMSESNMRLSGPLALTGPPSISHRLSGVVDGTGTLRTTASLRRLSNCSVHSRQSEGVVVLHDMDGGGTISLLRQIGVGGYGKVFLGEYFGIKVAVKAVFGENLDAGNASRSDMDVDMEAILADKEREEKMAQLEALLMSMVDNEYIVKTIKCLSTFRMKNGESISKACNNVAGYGQSVAYQWFVIMEYCSKGCLWKALNRGDFHSTVLQGTAPKALISSKSANQLQSWSSNEVQTEEPSLTSFDLWAAVETLKEVVKAVMYLHANGVIHGDMKAANVLLASSDKDRREFCSKVADFGFSRILGEGREVRTKTYGTVTHMPPELLSKGILTPQTDVFSIGIVMWEIMMADGVHKDLSDADVILQVVEDQLRPEFPLDAPERFTSLAARCWAENLEDRPPLIEVLEELDAMQKLYCPQGQDSEHAKFQSKAPKPIRRKSVPNIAVQQSDPPVPIPLKQLALQHSHKSAIKTDYPRGTTRRLISFGGGKVHPE